MTNQNQTPSEIVRDVMTLIKSLRGDQQLHVTIKPSDALTFRTYFDFSYQVLEPTLQQPITGPSEVAAAMGKAYNETQPRKVSRSC